MSTGTERHGACCSVYAAGDPWARFPARPPSGTPAWSRPFLCHKCNIGNHPGVDPVGGEDAAAEAAEPGMCDVSPCRLFSSVTPHTVVK